jgi:hypothetical protein
MLAVIQAISLVVIERRDVYIIFKDQSVTGCRLQ